jgi:hypothetical protein
MWKIIRIVTAAVFCFFSVIVLEAQEENQDSYVNGNNKKIVVEIDYGNIRPNRTVEVPLVKGKTILELLQTAAEVKTHTAGMYVFVTSIDGVKGKRGEMAWYYTVDDKSPEKLAYSKTLNGMEQRVKWSYKKDVCSCKVDGKLNPLKK